MTPSASDLLDLDGGAAELAGWSVVRVSGADRERFLASQLTSDVVGLPVGEGHLTALLNRSGRLQAFCFLCKRERAIDLLVPDGAVENLLARLEENIIADDVAVTPGATGPMRLLLGPKAVAEHARADAFPVAGWGSRGVVVPNGGCGAGLPVIDDAVLEARRVLGGPPEWGIEVEQGQLVNETVLLETAVSFDKGCFLGQETVTKVASHRGAARGPAVLELDFGGGRLAAEKLAGRDIVVGRKARAGRVLSVVDWRGGLWALVSLSRELRVVGRRISCVVDGCAAVEAEIHPAPLLPAPTLEEVAEGLTNEASVAFAGDEPDRALELLERAVEVCPGWADAHEALGVVLGRLGRHRDAIERMQTLLDLEPSSIMAHSNLSLFHNQLGDREQAEYHLAAATRLSMGNDPEREDDQAEAAERADRRRRAEMYRQVIEIDPDDALAHFGLGELAVEEGRLDDAVGHLERAVEADSGHAAAVLALGGAFEALGEVARARTVYEHSVEAAARRGDGASATKMQERLNALRE